MARRCAKGAGDPGARDAARSRSFAALSRSLEAGIAALEGKPRDAAAAYNSVLSGRLAAGDPFGHALITVDAVAVLPEELVPAGAVETARAYLEEIGAAPLLARLTSAQPIGVADVERPRF